MVGSLIPGDSALSADIGHLTEPERNVLLHRAGVPGRDGIENRRSVASMSLGHRRERAQRRSRDRVTARDRRAATSVVPSARQASSASVSICWTHPARSNRTMCAGSSGASIAFRRWRRRTRRRSIRDGRDRLPRCSTRSRIWLTSMEWALWFKNAAIEMIVAMPSTTADRDREVRDDDLPAGLAGDRTDRSTTRQYVKVPMTSPMTRLLNGSRNNVCTTRGEN